MTTKGTSLFVLAALLGLSHIADAGTSYVRWGRTTCPEGSQVLYKGFMTGPHYQSGGAGSNILCAAETPQFVRGVAGRQGTGSFIWGVELQMSANLDGVFLKDNIPGGVLLDQDLPCVRCYVATSTDVMMIPGRQDCFDSGYEFQYKGYLVAEADVAIATNGRQRSEYVCLDEAPEGRQGGTANNNQALLYLVEIACGSLPCNPYVDGMEMTCAVCTY